MFNTEQRPLIGVEHGPGSLTRQVAGIGAVRRCGRWREREWQARGHVDEVDLGDTRGLWNAAAEGGSVTGAQAREARLLLGMTVDRLASRCEVSAAVIKAFENSDRVMEPVSGQPFVDRKAAIRAVLEAHGAEFLPESAGLPSVRLRTDSA